MPCYDDRDRIDLEDYQRVVRLLCEACKLLSFPDQTDRMSDELYAWKINHDKLDKEKGRH